MWLWFGMTEARPAILDRIRPRLHFYVSILRFELDVCDLFSFHDPVSVNMSTSGCMLYRTPGHGPARPKP